MVRHKGKHITYSSTGVNYDLVDPFKILMQKQAKKTGRNVTQLGYKEISQSRGETAYVIEANDHYVALIQEALGSKNLVADKMYPIEGKSYYDQIAQDTVATIINDLIAVGAKPLSLNAYWATYSYDWFKHKTRAEDLIKGWRKACDIAKVSWGGGETQSLPDIIKQGCIELAGSAIGIIKPKDRLTLGDKLTPGDRILLVESSGIHANGLTLARTIASRLPNEYATPLSDGKSYGESLLTPTHIYAKLIQDLFDKGVDIHYMVNITGHGWRKLMRANRNFTYVIDKTPEPQPVFKFIQEHSRNDDREMYGNFNMGAGFAVFVPQAYVNHVQKIGKQHSFNILNAGLVKEGLRQVIIKPKNNLVFNELGVR